MFLNNLIPVEEVLISKEIEDSQFACDLSVCKGACCTLESDFGAPLEKTEVDEISKILPIVKKYLPDEHIAEIEKNGFVDEKDGELMTKSVNRRACVFVYFDGDIAKCGIEKAFNNGEVEFRKPISCHLFPIRISKFGGEVLRYEKFSECTPAVKKGGEEKIKLIDFCEEPLKRKYGQKWFSKLREGIGSSNVIT